MKYNYLIFLFVVLILASCARRRERRSDHTEQVSPEQMIQDALNDTSGIVEGFAVDTFFYYQRGACYGMCPIFNLTIFTDGQAIYEGKNFVDRIGFYRTTMDETVLQKITKSAMSIGYFSLEEEYDNPHITDIPTTKTALRSEYTLKWVTNRYKGPASLKIFYNEVDSIIGHQTWMKVAERE